MCSCHIHKVTRAAVSPHLLPVSPCPGDAYHAGGWVLVEHRQTVDTQLRPQVALGKKIKGVEIKTPYSGKVLEEENFCEFQALVAIHKSFLCETGGAWCLLAATAASNPQKFSLQKCYFPQIHESLLPGTLPAIR